MKTFFSFSRSISVFTAYNKSYQHFSSSNIPLSPPSINPQSTTTNSCKIFIWLSRDPIEERGGFNLYGIGGNDLINKWDYLGLVVPVSISPARTIPFDVTPYKNGQPVYGRTGSVADDTHVNTSGRETSRNCCEITIEQIVYRPIIQYYQYAPSVDGVLHHEYKHVLINTLVLEWGAKTQTKTRKCKLGKYSNCSSLANAAGRGMISFIHATERLHGYFDSIGVAYDELGYPLYEPSGIDRAFGTKVLPRLNALRSTPAEDWVCPE